MGNDEVKCTLYPLSVFGQNILIVIPMNMESQSFIQKPLYAGNLIITCGVLL